MRIALVALVALVATPAVAGSDTPYLDYLAKRNTDRAARQAALTASCDRLGGAGVGDTAATLLRSCWGKPHRVNVTTTASGSTEQWVYSRGYFYLTNGIVTAAQTSR